jgi:hypothetical protein
MKASEQDPKVEQEPTYLIAKPDEDNILVSLLNDKKDIVWGINYFRQIENLHRIPDSEYEEEIKQAYEMFRRYDADLGDDYYKHMYTYNQAVTNGMGNTEMVEHVLPIPFKFFPLIRKKVDQMVGEYMVRPERRRAQTVDEESVNARDNRRLELQFRKITKQVDETINKAADFNVNPDVNNTPVIENIERYMEYEYKDMFAEMANDCIDYLLNVRNLKERMVDALKYYLLTNQVVTEIIDDEGDPMPFNWHPGESSYGLSPTEKFLDRAAWARNKQWVNLAHIVDEFRDDLEPDDVRILEKFHNDKTFVSKFFDNFGITDYGKYVKHTGQDTLISVTKLYWRAYTEEVRKESKNKKGKKFFKAVSPDYKPRSYEKLYKKTWEDCYQIVNVAGLFWLRFGQTENQDRTVDNIEKCSLPITGLVNDQNLGVTRSFAMILAPIEDWYNEILYKIRWLSKQAGGKVLLYDVSQMPANFGKSFERLAYNMEAYRVIAVDLSKAGMDGNFNQWKEFDLGLTQQMTQLLNIKAMIEDLADDISGVTEGRQGSIGQYETATNAKENIRRSSIRSEVWLWPFDQYYKRVCERLISMAKHIWPEGKKLAYWKGDMAHKILEIYKNFQLRDYAFYVGQPYKEAKEKEVLEQVATEVLTSAGSNNPRVILALLKILRQDSYREAEQIFEKAMKEMEQIEQQMKQAEMESQEKQAQLKVESEEKERDVKREGFQKDIKVAQIQAKSGERKALIVSDEAEMERNSELADPGLQKEDDKSKENSKDKTKSDSSKKKATEGGENQTKAKNNMSKSLIK